jgi:PhoH-like ATPase
LLKPYDVEPAEAAESSVPEAMPKRSRNSRKPKIKKLFVLDTNVLMHDPASLFRFEEHDIYLPMGTLEELDSHKKGLSDVGRNPPQGRRERADVV